MDAGGARVTPPLRPAPPDVAELAAQVLAELDPLTERLVASILEADPSYGLGRTSREDLHRSCHDNLARILQSLTGAVPQGRELFDAPAETGHRRAEQGMPLESVLHAYRLGHRTIWDALVERARSEDRLGGLVEAASHVWEAVDAFSSVVATSYRETEARLVRQDDRRREALVDALLEGRGRERSVAMQAAAGLDLPEHGRFLVVVLEGTEAGRAVGDALSVRGVRAAWRTRADRELALVALPATGVPDVVCVLRGVPGVRAGLSPVVEGLAEVDTGHRLADTALRALPPGPGVAELDQHLAGALLVTAPDLAARLVQRALGGLLALDTEEREVLLLTLSAWLATGGSAGQTAARLYCHRNTVLNRLRRVEALTGRSLERVDYLVEWSLALLAREVLPPDRPDGPAPPAPSGRPGHWRGRSG